MEMTWKELCEQVDGKDRDKKILVYDFDAPKGSGKFYEQQNEDGKGIYNDSLTGGTDGE